ncbi:phage tail assembly protein [uncultured Endozoicomonas sp.]|uniref:phage tail assembly protein n=1 Tax=uncultured Endozoicomonas sp. TaxID=432652 RepID=UPI002635B8B5|nr:phage tail assembly protein [uncultured Endozoicomonas sp.]
MMEFDLKDGMTIGQGSETETHRHVILRQLGAADVMDAMEASERVVPTPDGYQLVSSPARMGLELLRRQVKKLGVMNGPLSLEDLRRLSSDDLSLLQAHVEALDTATAKEIESRGRVQPAGDHAGG